MFTLYPPGETEFFNNGLLEIDDIITSCKVENGINSPFIANLTIFKDELEKYKEVEGEKIILLPTPRGKQPFRIVDVMPIDDFEMNVFCRHVFHDIGKRTVNRCKVDNGNGAFILNKFKESLDKQIPHNFTSNIATKASLDWVRKKGLNALLEDDNSFLNKLGGELDINGFNVAINTRIGNDKGFTAMYRKNITGFNGKISFDGLITRIMPVGFDGITLNELYVDSENVKKYNDIYSDIVEFNEVKWKGSTNNSSEEGFDTLEQAQEELIKQAKQYYLDTKCDIVQANFDVNIALLADTEEYKDTAILEQLFLGDDMTIDFEPFNIKMVKRMVNYTYDSILKRYETIQLGKGEDNYFNDVNDKIDKLPTQEEVSSGLQDAIDQAFKNVNDLISNGGNNSYIKFIPNILNPREIVACDNEDLAKAVYCVRFNKAGIGVSTTGFNGTYQGLVTEGKLAINEITCNAFTAALIKAGILSDITGKTWINMDDGTFNFADKIKFDGKDFSIDSNAVKTSFNSINASVEIGNTGLLIKNGMFTIMDKFNKKIFGTDLDGNVMFSGRLQPNDNIIRLFGNDCLLDGSANALRRMYTKNIYDSVDSAGYWRLFNQYSNNGTRYASIGYEADGHLSIYNNSSRLKMLQGAAWLQARNTGDNAFCPITSSNFDVSSKREFKTNIAEPTVNFKNILMDSKIEQYNYKSEVATLSKTRSLESPDLQIGLILEDLTEEAREVLHTKGGAGISLYSMISVLWKTCQEQELRLQKLEGVK